MVEKIGSPLQGAQPTAQADPLAGSSQPGAVDEYSQVLNIGQQEGEVSESGRVVTSENAFQLQAVPGYPSLSVAAYSKQFFSARPAAVSRWQRALVAAGYLRKEDIGSLGDPFDHATRQSIEWLLQDSVFGGYRPKDILNYRIQIKSGQKPGSIESIGQEEMDEKAWKGQMTEAYQDVWRQPPPPNYLQQFQNMNPEEFTAYERAKVTWEQSGVAEDERKELASLLAQHMNQPRQVPGHPGAGQVVE